jgi:hypothetical protein
MDRFFVAATVVSLFANPAAAQIPGHGPMPVVNPVCLSETFSAAMQKRVADAVVRVTGGAGVSGTGIVIGTKGPHYFILTAQHVIEGKGDLRIDHFHYAQGDDSGDIRSVFHGVEVVRSSKLADLALLRVHVKNSGYLPLPIRICPPSLRPVPAFAAFTLGCDTPTPSIQLTHVTDTHRALGLNGTQWLIADRTAHGRSGGPLVDERGMLVGLASRFGPENRGVYQGLDEIYTLCDDAGMTWLYGGESRFDPPSWDIITLLVKLLIGKTLIALLLWRREQLTPKPGSSLLSVFILAQFPLVWCFGMILRWCDFPVFVIAGFLVFQLSATTALFDIRGMKNRAFAFGFLVAFGTLFMLIIKGQSWLPTLGCVALFYLDLAAYAYFRTAWAIKKERGNRDDRHSDSNPQTTRTISSAVRVGSLPPGLQRSA